MIDSIKKDLQSRSTKERAIVSQRYFKTGKGDYGEGDIFIGVTVPDTRKIARKYKNITLNEIKQLLESKIHEYRLLALLILVDKYRSSEEKEKIEICDFYLKHAKYVNNWDLVDSSAHLILGEHLTNKDRSILEKLAKSSNLWEKRIAIIATMHFIRNNEFQETFKIATILLDDKHDLIHKAVGWMLREVGKKDKKAEEQFLKKYYKEMPRTMLRYAIEKFPKDERDIYIRK